MNKQSVIQVSNLKKKYGEITAVDAISFDVRGGEIFGLLGPNGAGKTTTLECLEGLRRPDSGNLEILGIDPAAAQGKLKNSIGVQLQKAGLPPTMQVEEALRFFCSYHHVKPVYSLLTRLGLDEHRKKQYRELSTGQQRRLELVLAIAHKPKILILDEPTAGLDVASRNELHVLMEELRSSGTAIILATHDMAEAEKLADRIAILLKGKIAASGTPMEITAAGAGLTKISLRTEKSVLSVNGHHFPGVSRHRFREQYATYYSTDPGRTIIALLTYLNEQTDELIDLRVERPSLEERFLELTNTGVKS